MNKQQYKKILKYLLKFFPKADIPQDTLETWYIVFEPLNYDAVLLRVLDAVENEKFFPYPAYFKNEVYDGYLFYLNAKCMSEQMKKNLDRIREAVG